MNPSDGVESIVQRDWQLTIDVDMVLRGQGAEPAAIRQRRPKLIEIAQRALDDGLRLIRPAVVSRQLSVTTLRHENMILSNDAMLKSELLARHLAPAEQINIVVCTIGSQLEQYVADVLTTDPAYGLALDSVGSIAVEALSVDACARFEAQAKSAGMYTSVPLSPGMIGWPVAEGQLQIFSILDAELIDVTLNEQAMMIPRKSISMILGLSRNPFTSGRTCDFCSLRDTCRYQDHYAQPTL